MIKNSVYLLNSPNAYLNTILSFAFIKNEWFDIAFVPAFNKGTVLTKRSVNRNHIYDSKILIAIKMKIAKTKELWIK